MTTLQSHATTVGELLRETRGAAGLTTRQIGPMVGVSFTTVAKWERGLGEPSATQFVLWARATKQPLNQMIEGLSALCTPWDSNPEPTD
uniref:helix-turn-helix domain-containing protein n=1 Tax=Microbacterium proteolyticum TaxID=1572644 RepID=UPI003D6D66CF